MPLVKVICHLTTSLHACGLPCIHNHQPTQQQHSRLWSCVHRLVREQQFMGGPCWKLLDFFCNVILVRPPVCQASRPQGWGGGLQSDEERRFCFFPSFFSFSLFCFLYLFLFFFFFFKLVVRIYGSLHM